MKKGGFHTFGVGKAETIHKVFNGHGDPLLVCGDNDNDYYMLNLPGSKLGLVINRRLEGKIDLLVKKAIEQNGQEAPRYILQGYDKNLGLFVPSINTIAYRKERDPLRSR